MAKVLRIVFIVWLLATIIFVALYWRMIHMVATYNTVILPPMYSEPVDLAEARQQDLDYFRKLIRIDRSFSEAARHEFLARVDQIEADSAAMSEAAFYLALREAAALADNGHSNVSDGPLIREFAKIGAKLYWFVDGLFVVRADAAHAGTVGARVIAVDGRDMEDVVTTLQQYRGGNPAWRKLLMPLMIESPAIMHAAGLADDPGVVTMTLEFPSGARRDIAFAGTLHENATDLPRRDEWMTLRPEPLPDEDAGWERSLTATGAAAPLYLRDTEEAYVAALPGNGHYIRTKTGFGSAEQSIQEFFEAAIGGIDDGALDYLVVDCRWNGGGDYMRSIDFAKTAPGKVRDGGTLYLLVGPNTFLKRLNLLRISDSTMTYRGLPYSLSSASTGIPSTRSTPLLSCDRNFSHRSRRYRSDMGKPFG